jgi:hypothetical protein
VASTAETQLTLARQHRDTVKAQLDGHVERLRGDMEQRGIGGRIADEATDKAIKAFEDASQVASDSKGVIGGTVALLAIWLLRRPLIAAFAAVVGIDNPNEGYRNHEYW